MFIVVAFSKCKKNICIYTSFTTKIMKYQRQGKRRLAFKNQRLAFNNRRLAFKNQRLAFKNQRLAFRG